MIAKVVEATLAQAAATSAQTAATASIKDVVERPAQVNVTVTKAQGTEVSVS